MYSEFAYSNEMQLILMAIAFLYNFLQMYFIAKLIMRIHGEKASAKQQALFAFATGVVLYTLFIYIIYYLGGMLSFDPLTYLLVVTPNPLTALLYCLLGIKILKLSPVRSIELMGNAYLYYSIINSITRLVGSIFFVQTIERYNYLLDATRNITSFIIFIAIYGITSFALEHKHSLIIPKTNIFVNEKRDWLFFIVKAVLIYLCAVLIPLFISEERAANTIIFIFLFMLFVLTLLITNYVHANADRRNKEAHINSLIRTIEEFRAIKHDFYNILQTYAGYFAVGDLDACRKYHDKLVDVTVQAGESLDLGHRMNENPALVSLLMDKHIRAESLNVRLDFSIQCPMCDLPIEELDICRIISCLLDNAIEAAHESELKRASFLIEQKAETSKLIIITNSISQQPDMTEILIAGVTSKAGHQGIGLSNIRRIIDKYGNCTFQLNCYSNEMTAYIELKK